MAVIASHTAFSSPAPYDASAAGATPLDACLLPPMLADAIVAG